MRTNLLYTGFYHIVLKMPLRVLHHMQLETIRSNQLCKHHKHYVTTLISGKKGT